MNARGFVIAIVASAMLLAGCAVTHPGSTPTRGIPDSPTPSPTPALVDPDSYPLPSEELSTGMKGVMFTAGGGELQCAIFDPLNPIEPVATPPEFGCVVNVDGFPYPPADGGVSDSYNAFVSWGHQAAMATLVTDATYSGDTPASALPTGKSITWSTVTCTALAADDVRWVDSPSGHGMRVSVRDYQLF